MLRVKIREVIFIADDFGRSQKINRAIVESHRRGALHGASLMLGQAGTEEAVHLARDNPGLQIGWHLHLADSVPMTRETWPWGDSLVRAGFSMGLTRAGRQLMRDEIRAQWEAFVATGLTGRFFNSHHHLHAHPHVYRELLGLVPSGFAGWIRLGDVRSFPNGPKYRGGWNVMWRRRRETCPWPSSDTLWGVDRIRRMQADEIRSVIETLQAGRHEFMFHPMDVVSDGDFEALVELRDKNHATSER